MRDQEVYQQLERMASAISSDNANLQRANVLMRSRIDALEKILFGGRLSILKMIFMQMLSPRAVATLVQYTHGKQIEDFNAAKAAAEKRQPKVKPAPVEILRMNGGPHVIH